MVSLMLKLLLAVSCGEATAPWSHTIYVDEGLRGDVSVRMDCAYPIPPADLHQHPSHIQTYERFGFISPTGSKACIVGAAFTTLCIRGQNNRECALQLTRCHHVIIFISFVRGMPCPDAKKSAQSQTLCNATFTLWSTFHFEKKSEQEVASLLRCVAISRPGGLRIDMPPARAAAPLT